MCFSDIVGFFSLLFHPGLRMEPGSSSLPGRSSPPESPPRPSARSFKSASQFLQGTAGILMGLLPVCGASPSGLWKFTAPAHNGFLSSQDFLVLSITIHSSQGESLTQPLTSLFLKKFHFPVLVTRTEIGCVVCFSFVKSIL